MPQQQSDYDPHIGKIDARIVTQPDPVEVDKNAVRLGILHLDGIMPAGLNTQDGEYIVIQGKEKHRKTTLALNFVRNIIKAGKLKGAILWETLESGSSPVKVKQQLICMEATAILAARVYGGVEGLPMSSVSLGAATYRFANMREIEAAKDENGDPIFNMSVRRMLGVKRTKLQQWAIEQAEQTVNSWPIIIYGAPERQGATKRISTPTNGAGDSLKDHLPFKRWVYAIEKYDVEMITVDHASAYEISNAYELSVKYVAHSSGVTAEYNVVFLSVAQTSLSTKGEYAVGGAGMAREANIVLETEYSQANPYTLPINPNRFRDEPAPRINVPIERYSGLIFPHSYPRRFKEHG